MALARLIRLRAVACVLAVAMPGGCGRSDVRTPPALGKPTAWKIAFERNGEGTVVRIIDLPPPLIEAIRRAEITHDNWARIFPVSVELPDAPPMLGRYDVTGEAVVFTPQFPLRPGLSYRAVFDLQKLPNDLSLRLPEGIERIRGVKFQPARTYPAGEPRPTTVTAIYPTSNVLPENQLKFYIHFSAPMSRGEAYDRVRLEKASGEVVPIPFLELSEELWDADQRRFTIFFEPGRIKRGVMLRDEIGPALVAGNEYALVVDGDWRDANGKPLGNDFRKTFRTSPLDETQPDPHQWKLAAPPANSREPLIVEFNEPLDHAMLHRVLRVVDAKGEEKVGEVVVDRQETRWAFTPDEAWGAGKHELVVAGVLEDLAGNSVGRKFEVRLENKDDEVLKEVRVPFSVDPPH